MTPFYICRWPDEPIYEIRKSILFVNIKPSLLASSPEEATELFSEQYCDAWSDKEYEDLLKKYQNKTENNITYSLIDCYQIYDENNQFLPIEKYKIWTIINSDMNWDDFNKVKKSFLYY